MNASAPAELSNLLAGNAKTQGINPAPFVGVLGWCAGAQRVNPAACVRVLACFDSPGIDPAALVTCQTGASSRQEARHEDPQIPKPRAARFSVPSLRLGRAEILGKDCGDSEDQHEKSQHGCAAKISHVRFLSGRQAACGLHGRGAEASRGLWCLKSGGLPVD